MANTMGRYCKAYPVTRFREFPRWGEKTENLRKDQEIRDGQEIAVERQLTDDDFLYLQQDYTVTDGIYLNEHVIFDEVTPEWVEYCKDTLGFEVPDEDQT